MDNNLNQSENFQLDASFESSNYNSNTENNGEGPVPKPKRKVTSSGIILDKNLTNSSTNVSLLRNNKESMERIAKYNADKETYNLIVQDRKRREEFKKYAPKNILEEEILNTSGEDSYKTYIDAKNRLQKLSDRTFASLSAKNANINAKTIKEDFSFIESEDDDSTVTSIAKGIGRGLLEGVAISTSLIGGARDKILAKRYTAKEEAEMDKLKSFIDNYEKPNLLKIEKKLKEDEAKALQLVNKNRQNVGQFDIVGQNQLNIIKDNYERARKELENAKNKSGFFKGLITDRIGLIDLPTNLLIKTPLYKKAKEVGWEGLTKQEQELLKSYEVANDIKNQNLNPNSWYSTGKSVRQSGEFMGEMLLGGGIFSKGAGGVLRKGAAEAALEAGEQTVKGIAKIGYKVGEKVTKKVAGAANEALPLVERNWLKATRMATVPLLQPGTYNQAVDAYTQSGQLTTDENGNEIVLVDNVRKGAYYTKMKNEVTRLTSEINLLKNKKDLNPYDLEKINFLESKRNNLTEGISNVFDDFGQIREKETSGRDAFLKGYSSMIKENFSENVIGGLADTLFSKIGKTAGKTLSKGAVGRGINATADWSKDMLKVLDDKLVKSNKVGNVTKQFVVRNSPAHVFHSLPAEWAEELFIELTPHYGQDFRENVKTLTDPEFHKSIILDTLIMGGGFQAFGAGIHYGNMAFNKEYREGVKAQEHLKKLNEYFNIIDKKADSKLAKDLGMINLKTPTDFDEVTARIAELRDPKSNNPEGLSLEDKNNRANYIEKMLYTNAVREAYSLGLQDELRNDLKASIAENAHPDTVKNVTQTLAFMDTFENTIYENRDKFNGEDIIALEFNKQLKYQQLGTIKEHLDSAIPDVEELISKYNSKIKDSSKHISLDTLADTYQAMVTNDLAYSYENIPEERRNLVVDFLKKNSNNKALSKWKQFSEAHNLTQYNLNEIEKEIEKQIDPKNQEALKKKKKEEQNAELANGANLHNEEETQKEIHKTGADPKNGKKVIEKVAKQEAGNNVKTVKTKPIAITDNDFDPETLVIGNPDAETPKHNQTTPPFKLGSTKKKVNTPTTNTVVTQKQGNKIEDLDGQISQMESQTLFAPKEIDEETDADRLSKFEKGITNILSRNKNLLFEDVFAGIKSHFGSAPAEHYFNFIVQAWENVTGEKIKNKDEIYENFFGDIENSGLSEAFGPVNNTTQIVTPEVAQKEEVETKGNKLIGTNPETGVVQTLYRGFKTVVSNIRLATLGLKYKLSDDGLSYETIDNTINPDAMEALHPNNFKVGDKVRLEFKWDYLDLQGTNPMRDWEDNDTDRPIGILTTIKDKVENIFGVGSYNEVLAKAQTEEGRRELLQNEDFLMIMPTGFVLNGKQIESGINDYHWFNALNIGLEKDPITNRLLVEKRDKVIREARALNLATRKAMLNGDLGITLTVEERRPGFDNKVIKDENGKYPLNTILQSFGGDIEAVKQNTAIATIGKGNKLQTQIVNGVGVLRLNGKNIKTSDIVNLDNIDFTKHRGKTILISPYGEDKYVAHVMVNNHESLTGKFKFYNSVAAILESHSKNLKKGTANEQIQKIEEALNRFGISLLNNTFRDEFLNFYPEQRVVEDKEGNKKYLKENDATEDDVNVFRQDFKPQLQGRAASGRVINMMKYDSVEDFFKNLLEGNVETTTYTDILINNLHNPYIYTKIESEHHAPVWSIESNPNIIFTKDHLKGQESLLKEEGVSVEKFNKDKEDLETLRKQQVAIKEDIDNAKNEEEKIELQQELEEVEEKIKPLKEKVKKQETVIESVIEGENTEDLDNIEIKNKHNSHIREEVLQKALRLAGENSKYTTRDLQNMVVFAYDETVKELREKGLNRLADYMEDQRDNMLDLGKDTYEDSIMEHLNAILDINKDESISEETEFDKDQMNDRYDYNGIDTVSGKARLLFAGLKDTRVENSNRFGGFNKSVPFSETVNALSQIMATLKNNTLKDIKEEVDRKIELNPKEFGFYQELYERLENLEKTNSALFKQIMFSLNNKELKMNFIAYSKKGQESSFQVFNADSKNPIIKTKRDWSENFQKSSLIERHPNGVYTINKEVSDRVYELYKDITEDRKNPDLDKLSEYLSYFGISLNENTLKMMADKTIARGEQSIYIEAGEDENGEVTSGDAGIMVPNKLVDNLKANLDNALKSKKQLIIKPEYLEDSKTQKVLNLLTNDITSSLNHLIVADTSVRFISANSMYIAGKIINAYQQPNNITNTLSKIKHDKEYVNNMLKNPTTSNNFIMEMMREHPDLLSFIDVSDKSLEAMKELGTKSRDDMGVTELSKKDITIMNLAYFTNNEGKISDDRYEDKRLSLRKTKISFPTMSDSSKNPTLNTVVLDLKRVNFNQDVTRLDDNVLGHITDRMVLPELRRISQYLVGQKGKTNVKGLDAGSRIITSFFTLNNVYVNVDIEIDRETKTVQRPLIEVFKRKEFIEDPQKFIDTYKQEIYDHIQENINEDVNKYISEDGTSGIFLEEDVVSNLDSKYLETKDGNSTTEKLRMTAFDYVVNYYVNQYEIQNIFAGDMANYFKDGMVEDIHAMLPVSLHDLAKEHYPELPQNRIDLLLDKSSTEEGMEVIRENFPKLLSAYELSASTLDEIYENNKNAYNRVFKRMSENVSNNLSKRLKGQVSPGNQSLDSKGGKKYYQIMLEDVDRVSSTIQHLFELHYPNTMDSKEISYKVGNTEHTDSVASALSKIQTIGNIYEADRTKEEKNEYKALLKAFEKSYPNIAPFLKNASTDAQEYATWRDNLEQNFNRGFNNISEEDYWKIYDKLEAQELDIYGGVNRHGQSIKPVGHIRPENRWREDERELRDKAIMQPTKPLYSGVHYEEDENGLVSSRYIYIKSSSFPLLPELMEKFPDTLGNMGINMKKLEDKYGATVRASFDSANKVGAVRKGMSMSQMYDPNLDINNILGKHAVELDRSNFYIQQDKPYDPEKNRKTLATQFKKILLGDGVNKIKEPVFDNLFDSEILDSINANLPEGQKIIPSEDNKLTGIQLSTIYAAIAEKQQKIYSNSLKRKFGVEKFSDMNPTNIKGMEAISDMLKEELTNKQDRALVELVYTVEDEQGRRELSKEEYYRYYDRGGNKAIKAEFKMPIFMIQNSNKIEQKLLSKINKQFINEKVPGWSSPVSSSEGFTFEGFDGSPESLQKLKDRGLVLHPNFDPSKGLQSVRTEDGKIKYAQVFVSNKWRIRDRKTGKMVPIDLKKYLQKDENGNPTNLLDLEKFPEELLSVFSFRIPTSSHQSGALVEIAGFLPEESADLMIVPSEHATQIGEDYDIDTRYVYQYNYDFDENGNVVKVDSDYINKKIDELEKNFDKKEKWEELVESILNISIAPGVVNKDFEGGNLLELDEETKEILKEAQKDRREAHNKVVDKLKMQVLENQIISMYKTVMGSSDTEVQTLINKVLSTDNAQNTADEMDRKIKENNPDKFFNIYSPHVQDEIMSRGSSGKIGIGEHSNAVVFNSLLQQSPYTHKLVKGYTIMKGEPIYYDIKLGDMTFDGVLGKVHGHGKIRLSEAVMESQNSATDNQKLAIMGKRNENKYTMTVLKILQAGGHEWDGTEVRLDDGSLMKMSYPSLYINQPIIRRYAELMGRLSSSTTKVYGDVRAEVAKMLAEEYPNVTWQINKDGKKIVGQLDLAVKEGHSANHTSSALYDSLVEPAEDASFEEQEDFQNSQWAIFENFLDLQGAAKKYNDVQKLLNIEKEGMGISYFNVLELMDKVEKLGTAFPDITNQSTLIGDYSRAENEERANQLLDQGYIHFKDDLYIRPTTQQGHIIVNSLTAAYNLYNYLFPYDNRVFSDIISDALNLASIEDGTPRALEMKYMIMDSIKDMVYSNNKTLFKNDVEKERRNLFFDHNTNGIENQSLATFMSNLKESNDPGLREMFTSPFFKDLEFDLDFEDNPSIIKFNNSDMSPSNSLNIFSTIRDYSDNTDVLPIQFNGKDYTYEELIRDLLKYSLLADQGRGAIGFRQYFHPTILERYNVTSGVRNSMNPSASLIHNLLLNGPYKALENIAGSKFSSNGVLHVSDDRMTSIIPSVVRQINQANKQKYGIDDSLVISGNDIISKLPMNDINNSTTLKQIVQHNPTMFKTLRIRMGKSSHGGVSMQKNDASDILSENGYTLKDLNDNKVNSLFYQEYWVININTGEERKVNSKYVPKEDESIITKTPPFFSIVDNNNNVRLFELENETQGRYRQIPTLGKFGMNEYILGRNVDQSQIKRNQPGFWNGINQRTNLTAPTSFMDETGNVIPTVSQIVDSIKNDPTTPMSSIINFISNYVDFSKTDIKIVETLPGVAGFKYVEGVPTVFIKKEFIESEDTTKEKFNRVITEELLHNLTKSIFDQYLSDIKIDTKTGKVSYTIKEGQKLPSELISLMNVYSHAFKHMINKYGQEGLQNRLDNLSGQKENGSITASTDLLDAYRVSNIHEFIAAIFLKDTEFAKEMAEVEYMQSGKSILEKFSDLLTRLFLRVLPNRRTDTVSSEVATQLFSFLQAGYETVQPKEIPKPEIKKVVEKTANTKAQSKKIIEEEKEKEVQHNGKAPFKLRDTAKTSVSNPSQQQSSDDNKENKPLVTTWKGFWTRKDVENNPDKVFLFGDNFEDARTGYVPSSTQAVIRGLPNAIGISTKNNRGKNEGVIDRDNYQESSYLDNEDFERFKKHVDEQIAKAKDSGKTIVLPEDGIGTGKAQLKERAPKLFKYLNQKLKKLTEYNEVTTDINPDTHNQTTPPFKLKDTKGPEELGDIKGDPMIFSPNTEEEVKEGVNELFKENPELASIGTQEQYSQYLDTIFPDSKVKDILYHGVTKGRDAFNNIKNNGFSKISKSNWSDNEYNSKFFSDLSTAADYGINTINNPNQDDPTADDFMIIEKNIISAILNIDYLDDSQETSSESAQKFYEENKNKNNIGMYGLEGGSEGVHWNYVVFEPEQIHILGSKQDIKGFKAWKEKQNNSMIFSPNISKTENTLDKLNIFVNPREICK